jgi:hypothetical protein
MDKMETEDDVMQPHVGVVYRYNEQPHIGMESIRDSVVSKRTLACYMAEIFSLLYWLKENKPPVLTTHGYFCLEQYAEGSPSLNPKLLYLKYKKQFHEELRCANVNPLFLEELLTADLYMDYLSRQRHSRSGAFLSKSAYGVKKAGAFHLFRLHNGSSFPPVFNANITNLLRGFYRLLAARKGAAKARVRESNVKAAFGDDTDIDNVNVAPVGGMIGVTNDDAAQLILSRWNQVNIF